MMVVFAHHSRVELAINLLNDGKLLDRNGAFVNNRAVDDMKVFIAKKSAVSIFWIAPLCSLAKFKPSDLAVQSAEQAILNSRRWNGNAGQTFKPANVWRLWWFSSVQNFKVTFFRHPTQAFTNLRYFGTHLWHPTNTVPQLVSQSSGLGKLTRPESAPQ